MAGVDAFGIQLKRGDGASPEVFTAIANINDVKGPEIARDTIDVTAHDSVDGWREFVGGLKDAGELTLDLNYDPSIHDVLVADFEDVTPRNYQIVFPQGLGEWDVAMFITGFSQEAPVDDKLSAELKFKVTGKPVIVAGTGSPALAPAITKAATTK